MSGRYPDNPWDWAPLLAQRAEELSYGDLVDSLDARTRSVAQAAMPSSEELSKWLAADGGVRDGNIALIRTRSLIAFGIAVAVAMLLLLLTDNPATVAAGAIVAIGGALAYSQNQWASATYRTTFDLGTVGYHYFTRQLVVAAALISQGAPTGSRASARKERRDDNDIAR